jgi:hypothetical protein
MSDSFTVTPMNDQVDEGRVESPASRVDQAAATSQHGGSRSSTPIVRSALDDRRTAIHEAGHVVVGRALGMEVGGCTIVEGPDFAGLTWGPAGPDMWEHLIESEARDPGTPKRTRHPEIPRAGLGAP